MLRLLLAAALLVSSFPADLLSALPGEARDAVHAQRLDPAFPAERIERGQERLLQRVSLEHPPCPPRPGHADHRVRGMLTGRAVLLRPDPLVPTCERLPYDATAPPGQG